MCNLVYSIDSKTNKVLAVFFCWAGCLLLQHCLHSCTSQASAFIQPLQVCKQEQDLRVIGSQRILLDGNAAVVHFFSFLELAAGLQQDGNVVQAGSHIYMVRPQLLLADV